MINPKVQKIYDRYKALARTLPPNSGGPYNVLFQDQITEEILALRLPADPNCPNNTLKGHKATSTCWKGDYCGICGCRARWFHFGELHG